MGDAPHRVRNLLTNSTYHVFNRGRDRQLLFRCKADYDRFLGILSRLLAPPEARPRHDSSRNQVANFHGELVVIAYALMPNHFHLVIHQYGDPTAISRFMLSLETAYAMYFNRKYGRKGKVYEGRFHDVHLPTAQDVCNAIVYVNRNPDEPLAAGALTSHALYAGRREERDGHWCRADLGLKLFGSRARYVEHLHDAIAHRARERDAKRRREE
jgi:REP element-mobilizing transposase RayT